MNIAIVDDEDIWSQRLKAVLPVYFRYRVKKRSHIDTMLKTICIVCKHCY